ncbi:MAG: hypothetical protein L6Q81_17920, partial [Bacteroidia bacterium]|nr:hypothetical protein [Bacteroidia bacterium]
NFIVVIPLFIRSPECFTFLSTVIFCLSVQRVIVGKTNSLKGIGANGLRVAAVGDFGALHCQPALNLNRSTKLQVYTSPPIEATRCYLLPFSLLFVQLCVSALCGL